MDLRPTHGRGVSERGRAPGGLLELGPLAGGRLEERTLGGTLDDRPVGTPDRDTLGGCVLTGATSAGRMLSGTNSVTSGGSDSAAPGFQCLPSTGMDAVHRLHLIVVARPAKRVANSASGIR